jgi:hypothetical protein
MSETRKFDKGAKRNLILVGGVIAAATLATLLVFLASPGDKRQQGAAGAVNLQAVTDQGLEPRTGPMSPNQEQAVLQAQRQEAEAALRRGQSYFPTDQVNAPVPVGPTASIEQASLGAAGVHPGMSEDESRALERRRQGLERQLSALLNQAPAPRVERVTFSAEKAQGQGQVAQGAAPGQSGDVQAAQAQAQPQGPVVADALEIFAAVSTSPVDTYKTNYASAKIVSGPLAGAFLIGTAQPMEEGLSIEYSMMRHAGKTYQVSAIALDEATATNAVSANVDRRVFQRFILPIVLASTQGYHQARSQTGTTVVGIPTGTGDDLAGVTTPAPTREQARSAGIAKGLEIAGNAVQQEAAKPLRFTMENNTPMGIMFRAPVREAVN